MQLNPSEISELIKSRIQNLDAGARMRTQGTVVSVTDGICRIHGLSDVMQGEMLEFPKNTFGLALNLERDSVAVILGEYRTSPRATRSRPPARSCRCRRPGAPRPRGEFARPADRRQGADQRQDDRRDREGGAGRDRAPVGVAAGADRAQGDRLHGADRPRPARASSSATARPARPRSRSTRSSTRRARTFSASTSRSGRRPPPSRTWCASWKSTAPWPTPSWWPPRLRSPRRCNTSRRTRAAPWAILPRPRPGRAHHLRRPDQAGVGLPAGVAAPAAGRRDAKRPGRRVLPARACSSARRA